MSKEEGSSRTKTLEAPEVAARVERILKENREEARSLGRFLARRRPGFAFSVSPGVAGPGLTYARHLLGVALGLPLAPLEPAWTQVYRMQPALAGSLGLFFDPRPGSVALVGTARDQGALTVGLAADEASPLSRAVDALFVLFLEEDDGLLARFLAESAVIFQFLAYWRQAPEMQRAIEALPEALDRAGNLEWPAFLELFSEADRVVVVSLGPGVAAAEAVARGMARGLGRFAEARAIAEEPPSFGRGPVLVLAPEDEGYPQVRDWAEAAARKGATLVFASAESGPGQSVSLPKAPHPWAAPLLLARASFRQLSRLAAGGGGDR